ncbi:MAG: dTDP-4-dehydrorhamnose reductase [Pseudomonadales bacterium]|nr:dTDP-4-dehydrorhamnose reductase [Pseudomonadales bacterium]
MAIVLVTGGEGQLGQELKQHVPQGHDLVSLSKSQLDITQDEQIAAAFERYQPDWIINAAAFTDVEASESNVELVQTINVEAVKSLLAYANKFQARFLQISTDYVFDGKSSEPYKEDDKTKPMNVYGDSKLKAEGIVLAEKGLVVRTSWLYSSHHKNFLDTMLRLFENQKEVKVVNDQVGTPTNAASLAKILFRLIDQNADGIFHWSGGLVMSWYDFACQIHGLALDKGLVSVGAKVVPVDSQGFPQKAKRPAWSPLSRKKCCDFLDLEPNAWREELSQEIDLYGKGKL